MTRYDEVPGHPLAGVPQEVLNAARDVLIAATHSHDVDAEQAEPIADAVVVALREAGYVHWDSPAPVPSRDSLVLALLAAQYEWETQLFDSGLSLAEHLVDDMFLPLLNRRWEQSSSEPGKLDVGTECAGCGRDLPFEAETFSLVRWDARRQVNVLVSIHCGLCYRNGAIG